MPREKFSEARHLTTALTPALRFLDDTSRRKRKPCPHAPQSAWIKTPCLPEVPGIRLHTGFDDQAAVLDPDFGQVSERERHHLFLVGLILLAYITQTGPHGAFLFLEG